jgi:hypothetical protein
VLADLDLNDGVSVTPRIVDLGAEINDTQNFVTGSRLLSGIKHGRREASRGAASSDASEIGLSTDVRDHKRAVRLNLVHDSRIGRHISNDVRGRRRGGPLVADATATIGIGKLDTHESTDNSGLSGGGGFNSTASANVNRLELKNVGPVSGLNRHRGRTDNPTRMKDRTQAKRCTGRRHDYIL